MEFAHFYGILLFHGMLQNSVLVGDKGTNTIQHILVGFRWP